MELSYLGDPGCCRHPTGQVRPSDNPGHAEIQVSADMWTVLCVSRCCDAVKVKDAVEVKDTVEATDAGPRMLRGSRML